jgi:elongation factor P
MGVTNTTEVRGGDLIILDGIVYEVVERQHVKPGKGGAFVRLKIRNVKQGNVIDKTMNAGVKLDTPDVEQKDVQYLYNTGKEFHFMDQATYEQFAFSEETLGDSKKFLKPDMSLQVMMHGGDVLGIKLPITVELKITETGPDFRGNTASGSNKPATLETGAVIQVPFFIKTGEMVRVDTRTGGYIERV